MTKPEMIDLLNEIIKYERQHFSFYLQALMVIRGNERAYLTPLLEKEMLGELGHIRLFGDKVVALGGIPTLECRKYSCFSDGNSILSYAIDMEREVLAIYHSTYLKAEWYASEHNDMSIVLLLEENIEDTTRDLEELIKVR